MASTGKNKLAALTSSRFIAAMFVILFHIRGDFGIPSEWGLEYFYWAQGVSFFFVLSGFILTYVYPDLEGFRGSWRFLIARFARIWPAHVLLLIVSALLLKYQNLDWNASTLLKWLASLTMVQVWLPNTHDVYYFLNAPAWSISAEFFFYLAFIFLIPNFRASWSWKLLVALCLALFVCLLCQDGHLPGFPKLVDESVTYHNPLSRIFEFVFGMCCGLAFQRIQQVRLGTWQATSIEIAAIVVMVGAAYATNQMGKEQSWLTALTGSTLAKWQSWGAGAVPAFGLVIVVLGLGQGYISRLLSARQFVLLGELSYSIYLFHVPLLVLYRQHSKAFEGWSNTGLLVVYFLVLLLVSHFTFVAWERPLRSGILRICLGKRQQPAASPVPTFNLWATLTTPNWKLVTVEFAVLALVATQLHGYVTRPDYSLIDPHQADRWAAQSLIGAPGVEFAGLYRLRSATYLPADDGYRVHLVWESTQDQPLDNWVCCHLLDENQKRCVEIGRQQDPRSRPLPKGALWEHEIRVPKSAIGPEITCLAIGLWHPERGSAQITAGPSRPRAVASLFAPADRTTRQPAGTGRHAPEVVHLKQGWGKWGRPAGELAISAPPFRPPLARACAGDRGFCPC